MDPLYVTSPENEVDIYDGFDDADVDFEGGATSFNSEKAADRPYTLVVQNTSNVPYTISMGGSIEPKPGALVVKQGNFGPDATPTHLVASGGPKSYDILKEFCRRNPARIVLLKITTTQEAQLGANIVVSASTPWQTSASKSIPLARYTRPGDYNTKMAIIENFNQQFDSITDICIDIPGNCTTTFLFEFGAVYNTAKGLAKRAMVAKQNG